MRWASASTSSALPVASTLGSAATAARSAAPGRSGTAGTRSLASATRRSGGGSRRYQAGRAGGVVGIRAAREPSAPGASPPNAFCATRPRTMLGDLVLELARALTAAAPPPPALPYLGMDRPTDTSFHLLDELAARGIFRKYELVLDVGAGLGSSARWLAARRGCELAAQVRHLAAAPEALPAPAARFTHVWIVEALPRCADAAAALAEAWRALRPGGTLAVQDLVLAEDASDVTVPGWRFASLATRLAEIAAAGFVDVDVREASAEADERLARVSAARTLFAERAAAAGLGALVATQAALAAARAAGRLRVVQILARRP